MKKEKILASMLVGMLACSLGACGTKNREGVSNTASMDSVSTNDYSDSSVEAKGETEKEIEPEEVQMEYNRASFASFGIDGITAEIPFYFRYNKVGDCILYDYVYNDKEKVYPTSAAVLDIGQLCDEYTKLVVDEAKPEEWFDTISGIFGERVLFDRGIMQMRFMPLLDDTYDPIYDVNYQSHELEEVNGIQFLKMTGTANCTIATGNLDQQTGGTRKYVNYKENDEKELHFVAYLTVLEQTDDFAKKQWESDVTAGFAFADYVDSTSLEKLDAMAQHAAETCEIAE